MNYPKNLHTDGQPTVAPTGPSIEVEMTTHLGLSLPQHLLHLPPFRLTHTHQIPVLGFPKLVDRIEHALRPVVQAQTRSLVGGQLREGLEMLEKGLFAPVTVEDGALDRFC